jgi:hypothetical protein
VHFSVVVLYTVALWNLVQHVIWKYKLFPLDIDISEPNNPQVDNYKFNSFRTRAIVMTIFYFISLNLICVKDISGFRYIGIGNVIIYCFVLVVTFFTLKKIADHCTVLPDKEFLRSEK